MTQELRRRILEDDPPLALLESAQTSADAIALLLLLLNKNERERASAFPRGFADVRAHAWFDGLDWAAVESGELVAPGLDFRAHVRLVLGPGRQQACARAEGDDDPFADF
ncbi:hypothetical protein T492DRAFT_1144458 [Pavlovales sp. CCMP2436]|nr:hypothetical protein T492DRAFT_1144458 [Pavlovales sp. CCMP2436]